MIDRWRYLIGETLVSFNNDDGWAMASHVALSIIMALFPFLIFATALAGFLGNEDHADYIIAVVFDTWPDQIARPIASEIRTVLGQNNVGFLTAGQVGVMRASDTRVMLASFHSSLANIGVCR